MPEENSGNPALWPWLDQWFELRWRALLSWLVLAGLSVPLAKESEHWSSITIDYVISRVAGLPYTPLLGFFHIMAPSINEMVLLCWFQPVALRLNCGRGLFWVGGQAFLFGFICACGASGTLHEGFAWVVVVFWVFGGSTIALVSTLGWRSRAGLVPLGWALSWMVIQSIPYYMPRWLQYVVGQAIFAMLALFGTRLLPERGQTKATMPV